MNFAKYNKLWVAGVSMVAITLGADVESVTAVSDTLYTSVVSLLGLFGVWKVENKA